jgi:hypothetical protein
MKQEWMRYRQFGSLDYIDVLSGDEMTSGVNEMEPEGIGYSL